MRMCADDNYKNKILKFLKTADMDIEDIEVKKEDFDESKLPEDMPAEIREDIIKDPNSDSSPTSVVKYAKELIKESPKDPYDNV